MMYAKGGHLTYHPLRTRHHQRNRSKFCRYHNDHEHGTEECIQLKKDIEALIKRGRLKRFLGDRKDGEDKDLKGKGITEPSSQAAPNVRVVYVIVEGSGAGRSSSSQRSTPGLYTR